MTVKFYQWGKVVGGTESGGGAVIPAESPYGPPETFEGSVLGGSTTISLSAFSKELTVRNTHDSANLEYSFDGGATYLMLGPYGEKTYDIQVDTILLRDTALANPTYEIVAALGSS